VALSFSFWTGSSSDTFERAPGLRLYLTWLLISAGEREESIGHLTRSWLSIWADGGPACIREATVPSAAHAGAE
jgi:hypothetical protein